MTMVLVVGSGGKGEDAVGWSWHLEWPTNSDLRKALDILSEVGVKVSISELDVRVLPHPKDTEMGADIRLNVQRLKELDPYTDGIPDEILKKQAKKAKGQERFKARRAKRLSNST